MSGETADGIGAQRAETFGDFIDRGEEFFILGLECIVEREEAGTFDIPVSEMIS